LATLTSRFIVADKTEREHLSDRILRARRETIETAMCTGPVDKTGDELRNAVRTRCR